ncbi:MAG: HAD-IC family P-type ATPase [Archaeoglobaceae archaeon]|nr:HAD-IC family P-type ATPase [Archaeoglobaceae archaeon]
MNWWALDAEEVFKILETKPTGLDEKERKKRLEKFGVNEIKIKEKSLIQIFLSQIKNPVILVLLFSTLIFLYIDHLAEAVVVLIIVLLSIFVSFMQEWKAENIMRELRKFLIPKALVLINNKIVEVDSKQIVPGDVIVVEAGMKIPADARLFESKELYVDESILTGESFPVYKTPEKVDEKTLVADRTCMLYAGTVVTTGWGKAVVVSTGEKTELGKISKSIEQVVVQAPLIAKMKTLAKQLSFGIIAISTLVLILGIYRGYDSVYVLLAALSFAVAVIPEILPAVVTLSLAFGVKEMARNNALVKSLAATETLGGVTAICTDKTGTLTQNKMKVVKLVTKSGEYDSDAELNDELRNLILAGYICNRATCEGGVCMGDPTEIALLEIAIAKGIFEDFEIVDEIPFDSKKKFMAVAAKTSFGNLVVVKGAPEVVEKMCNIKIDSEKYAKMGMRILAFAWKKVEKFEFFKLEGLEYLGLQCLIDPVREDVKDSIESCKKAGIKVYMITGDHPATALTIAKQAGIDGDVIDGRSISNLDEDVKKYRIFARIYPEQKLEIVKALQKNGEIVAVTGDGVNDAPALKQAEIGVAMGSGSEVAKEAADVILLDDSFSTIVKAVEIGRDVFRKIQRFIAWILPTNGGQGLIVLSAFLLGISMPMKPIHVLWINTVTAALLGMMIVLEKKEDGLLNLKPTREEIINKRIYVRIAYISILTVIFAYYLFMKTGKMSSAVNSVVAVGVWYLLTPYVDKSFFEVGFRNKFAILGIFLTILIQFTVTNYRILDLEPLTVFEWLEVFTITFLVFLIVETEKFFSKFKSKF